MKLTKRELKRVVREEIERIQETGLVGFHGAPMRWEYAKDKFFVDQRRLEPWYEEFLAKDSGDREQDIVDSFLEEAYDKIAESLHDWDPRDNDGQEGEYDKGNY